MPIITPEYNLYNWSDLNFPTIEPSLKLDFANARALDPRITFTRASRATYVGRDGLIKTAGEDEPRFDHDPATGESLGLLIEGSSNNQYKYSDGGPIASTGNTTLTSNTTLTADPAGGNSASRIDRNLGGYAYQSINNSIGNSTIKTLSFWIKDNGSVNEAQVGTDGAGGRIYVNVDFSTSPPSLDWNSNNTNAIEQSLDIKEYPNGWYRVAMTFAGTQTPGYQEFQFMGVPDADYFIYGVQLELGTRATSYIPTAGATVTRAVEYGYTSNMDFYNQSEGSVFSEVSLLDVGNTTGKVIWSFNQAGGFGEGIYMVNENGSPNLAFNLFDGGSNLAGKGTTDITTGTYYKTIYSFETNNVNLGYYGNIGTDDTSATLPTIERLVIGNNAWGGLTGGSNGANSGNCHIKSFTYYPKRLTNTQLQTLTQ